MTEMTKSQLSADVLNTFDGLPRRTGNGEILSILNNIVDSIMPRGEAESTITGINSAIASLSAALGNKADATAVTNALALKADTSDVSKKPYIYFGGVQQTNPKMWIGSAVVSGGNAVFYLTDTGLVGGNAIFTNSTIFVQPILFAANAPPAFASLTLSGDRKTLTIPTSKATTGISLLSVNLLGANLPANGDTVSVWVVGT